jgi:hypothetical protein
MTFESQLAPFVGKFCSLTFNDKIAPRLKGTKWRLYFFDWKKVDEDTREQIAEMAGQDDYPIFAIVGAPEETGPLEEMIEDGVDGFLLWSKDTATIYFSMGEMETLTQATDEFWKGLTVLEEGEEVE